MDNFCFLIYTNETYQPIADLTMGEFNRYFPENKIKKYLVSNKFGGYDFENKNVIFLDCNVTYDCNGRHFAKTMTKALSEIDEEYIIFFCDDYMLVDKPNIERLKILCDVIQKDNIDFFSFASMHPREDWIKYDLKFEDLPYRNFYNIPDNYMYLYSVQPCIWKKSSLQEILKYNDNISLHDLDTTNIKNREGYGRNMNYQTSIWFPYEEGSQNYGFKVVCTDYKDFNELFEYDFFIFPYVEIMRHGFFNFWQETNTKRFFKKFIEEKNLDKNEFLNKFIPSDNK